MARVGPNQDINDPTTILEVGKHFYDKSVSIGILRAVSDTQNPYASGSPTPTIIIPLKIIDGSTYDLQCSRITDTFTVDELKLSQSVINTYINLAERFREYWELVRLNILSLTDFGTVDPTPVDAIPSTGTGDPHYTSGSLGGTHYEVMSTSFDTDVIDIPVGSGCGLTDYNYHTYPQLLNALSQLSASQNTAYYSVDEIYYWLKIQEETPDIPPHGNSRIMAYDSFPQVGAIQIPNFSHTTNKIVTLTGSASYNRTANLPAPHFYTVYQESVRTKSEVAIDNHDTDFSALSFITQEEQDNIPPGLYWWNFSVSIAVNHNREIVIPPNKSAFIIFFAQVYAEIGQFVGVPGSLQMNGTSLIEIGSDTGTYNRTTTSQVVI